MQKERVLVVHGWTGRNNSEWFPWIKTQLEKRGHETLVPAMPKPDMPKREEWVSYLRTLIEKPRERDIYIGHSVGALGVCRLLESFSSSTKIAKLILVAPAFKLSPEAIENSDDENLVRNWNVPKLKLKKVKNSARKIVCIFSDDDPLVLLDANRPIAKKLGAEIIVLQGQGHFFQDPLVTKLPILIDLINTK